MKKMNRREFIKLTGLTVIGAVLGFKVAVTKPTKAAIADAVKHEEEVWLLKEWETKYSMPEKFDPVYVETDQAGQLYPQSIFKDHHASVLTYENIIKCFDILDRRNT